MRFHRVSISGAEGVKSASGGFRCAQGGKGGAASGRPTTFSRFHVPYSRGVDRRAVACISGRFTAFNAFNTYDSRTPTLSVGLLAFRGTGLQPV
jgi:hypothetical protein